jgi:hypothetical protein
VGLGGLHRADAGAADIEELFVNEDMKQAWLEISQMVGEPTREELDVFLRTWQRAIQAERDRLAKECALLPFGDTADSFAVWIKNGGKA